MEKKIFEVLGMLNDVREFMNTAYDCENDEEWMKLYSDNIDKVRHSIEALESIKSKTYKLVCMNEDYEVVSLDEFHTLEEAHVQMESEFHSHIAEFEDEGEYIEDSALNERDAYVNYGDDLKYVWQIVKK